MARVILGNHTAVFAARSEQDKIRRFYCEVLGCKPRVKTEEVDRFQLDERPLLLCLSGHCSR